MSDFTVRADHIDVEQIMRQIRARIRDKRGADYTEAEIRELASVKLEGSSILARCAPICSHFARASAGAADHAGEAHPPLWTSTADVTLPIAARLPRKICGCIRQILRPILKLFFNVGPFSHVLTSRG